MKSNFRGIYSTSAPSATNLMVSFGIWGTGAGIVCPEWKGLPGRQRRLEPFQDIGKAQSGLGSAEVLDTTDLVVKMSDPVLHVQADNKGGAEYEIHAQAPVPAHGEISIETAARIQQGAGVFAEAYVFRSRDQRGAGVQIGLPSGSFGAVKWVILQLASDGINGDPFPVVTVLIAVPGFPPIATARGDPCGEAFFQSQRDVNLPIKKLFLSEEAWE